jgi:hypothetical protein
MPDAGEISQVLLSEMASKPDGPNDRPERQVIHGRSNARRKSLAIDFAADHRPVNRHD